MFNFIETKSYDINRCYGTDWVTEYRFRCDKPNLSIDETVEALRKLGHDPCGELSLIKEFDNNYTLKAVMY